MKRTTSLSDILINFLCIALLIGVTVYLIVTWRSLPNQVPAHYNAAGVVDRWGSKGELLILPIIAWILYVGITILEQFPSLWNAGVKVTVQNRDRVYRILKNMIGTQKLLVTVMLSAITINSALARGLSPWFLPVSLFFIFGSLVFFVLCLFRAR